MFLPAAAFATTATPATEGILANGKLDIMDKSIMFVSVGLAIFVNLAAILLFKYRSIQGKAAFAALGDTLLALGGAGYLAYQNQLTPNSWAWIPGIAAIVLNVLANRAIKRDEKLVRSMDRLR
jgi:Co/Zn/Cd efflux system component